MQVHEGLIELLRKKLVDEEEALEARDWDRVMQFLDESIASEVEKSRERLR